MKKQRPLGDILKDDLVVFLGAGASWDSGLPLGDTAASEILRICFEQVGFSDIWHATRDTEASKTWKWPRFELVLDVLNRYLPNSPTQLLSTFMSVGVSTTHQVLAKHALDSWLWLTTNFDNQIERALSLVGKTHRVVVSRGEMARLRNERVNQVVKLHGDASVSPEDLGVTMDQILRTFPDSARRALTRLASGRPLIVIGYAARDPDLRRLIRDLVTNATDVVWIDRGSEPSLIAEILNLRRDSRYVSVGSPAIFEDELKILTGKSIHVGSWIENVTGWAQSRASRLDSRAALGHALAALCIGRDVPACREAAGRILSAIDTSTAQLQRWRFETEFRRLEQMPTDVEPQLRDLVEEWKRGVDENRSTMEQSDWCESHTLLANYLRKHGNYENARKTGENAVRVLNEVRNTRVRVNALRALGLAQIYCGSKWLREGRSNLKTAVALAHQAGEPQLEAQTKEELAFGFIRANKRKPAARLLAQANDVFEEIGDPRLLVSCRRNLAETKRMEGNIAEAMKLNREVFDYATLLDDYEAKRKIANNLATCLLQSGKPIEAEDLWVTTVVEARLKGRWEYSVDPLHNRGWMRVVLADWTEAFRLLHPVVDLQLKRGSKERAGGTLSMVGWCLLRLGRTEDAHKTFKEIQRQGLIPAGAPRGYFIMLRCALKRFRGDLLNLVRAIGSELANYPEQRFLLYTWLLESNGILKKRVAAKLVEECLIAIKESGQRLLATVLRDILRTQEISLNRRVLRAIDSINSGLPRTLRKRVIRQLRERAEVIS